MIIKLSPLQDWSPWTYTTLPPVTECLGVVMCRQMGLRSVVRMTEAAAFWPRPSLPIRAVLMIDSRRRLSIVPSVRRLNEPLQTPTI